jgi:hypothetical protein
VIDEYSDIYAFLAKWTGLKLTEYRSSNAAMPWTHGGIAAWSEKG